MSRALGRTLQNLFKAFYGQLAKQDSVVAGKGDLIVVEEQTLKSMFSHKVRDACERVITTCYTELLCAGLYLYILSLCFLFVCVFLCASAAVCVYTNSAYLSVQMDVARRTDSFALGERDKILEQVCIVH